MIKTQRKTIDGIVYRKFSDEGLWIAESIRKGVKHGVICDKCGGFAFSLSYGDYELIATCVNCGTSGPVYTG